MAKYSIFGNAGAASITAATAGILKLENASTTLASPKLVYFHIGPAAAAADNNYAVQLKRQTTAGTWTSVTPSPLDPAAAAAKSAGGRASTAAGAASTILGAWGFPQRGGLQVFFQPGFEIENDRANSAGLIIEYTYAGGTEVNCGTLFFTE
jgi:hypothetical protein